MRLQHLSLVAGVSILVLYQATLRGEPATQPEAADLPAIAQQTVAVQRADDSGFLGSLARAMNALHENPKTADDEIRRLVNDLAAPHDPHALMNLILKQVTASDAHAYQSAPEWKLGNYADRDRLIRYLKAHAKIVRAEKRDEAEKLARAALLLAAYDNFLFSGARFHIVNDREFPEMASLSEEQWTAFKNALASRQALEKQFYEHYVPAMSDTDSIIMDPNKSVSIQTVDSAIQHLSAAGDIQRSNPGFAWAVIYEARNLRNLAIARNVKPAQERVENFLTDYGRKLEASGANDAPLRWIKEASGAPGKPLTSRRVFDKIEGRSKEGANGQR